MALENSDVVDSLGTENDTGFVVLTIADAWDWQDEPKHLAALQAKLNTYINFIESGQLGEAYPAAINRQVVIDVVGRFPLSQSGADLLKRASAVADELCVQIRNRHYAEP